MPFFGRRKIVHDSGRETGKHGCQSLQSHEGGAAVWRRTPFVPSSYAVSASKYPPNNFGAPAGPPGRVRHGPTAPPRKQVPPPYPRRRKFFIARHCHSSFFLFFVPVSCFFPGAVPAACPLASAFGEWGFFVAAKRAPPPEGGGQKIRDPGAARFATARRKGGPSHGA